jgi:tyrosinase
MPGQDRMDFVAAVECLQRQSSLYPEVDAAKSMFDDFVVLHSLLTPYVHNSVSVLGLGNQGMFL